MNEYIFLLFSDVRSFCRTVNSRISNTRERIEVLPNLRNVLPINFPVNVSQLRQANGMYNIYSQHNLMILMICKLLFKCTGPTINNFLTFYGLQIGGLERDRRKRLAEYMGIKLL